MRGKLTWGAVPRVDQTQDRPLSVRDHIAAIGRESQFPANRAF